ncbi:MAG: nucleotide exchange factor GrpE [Bacteroidia bacterium]|jgi:molecular chaperone GrpE|nr:nucleotide exchange factor GrpE [Bacteroidia bacterium]
MNDTPHEKPETTTVEQEIVEETKPEATDAVNENSSPDTAENANATVTDWEAQYAVLDDKYKRLYAEFDNYKRRTSAERIELFKTANQEVLLALLPALDDFSRALKAMEKATEVNAVKEGIELVNQKLTSILVSKGLKAMESVGKPFDSDFHEAITNIPAPSEELKGKVVDEVEKGYFLQDKVIRFAKVVVGE